MYKIKITQAGWENFTGNFGGVEFVESVSVDPVAPREAARLANLVQIENETGENPSDSQITLDTRAIEMSATMMDAADTAVSKAMAPRSYSREALEELVDEGGIAALRAIATPMGLKSNSAAKLIDMIIAKQTPTVAPNGEVSGLLGTDKLDAQVEIAGKQFPLGDVVRAAFKRRNVTSPEWNGLPEEERDALIVAELETMRRENPAPKAEAQDGDAGQAETTEVPTPAGGPTDPVQTPEQPAGETKGE